jgi:predicted nucleic-acid-binding protein
MIAFDTNLLVRFVVNDCPAQADIAEALMRQQTVFISRTVLLESEWVLRSRYGQSHAALVTFFQHLVAAENVMLEAHEQIMSALEWYQLGADFADALHLAACGEAVMHTFDHGFCKQARAAGVAPLVRILKANSATAQ